MNKRNHNLCDDMPTHETFAVQIVRWRQNAGLGSQADLAVRLGTSQQTISRWEQGASRPRSGQLRALAKVLGVDVGEMRKAAGYSPSMATVTFDQPFPVDQLSEESFERFCADFLAATHRGANVSRLGGRGHTQDGADIEVTLDENAVLGFQCKKEKAFGPQKVDAAVGKYKRSAMRRYILLASVASPQARDAIKKHHGWQLWDKEDIAREVRKLPTIDQRRLVDTYFPTQRLALIGATEAGPWLSFEDFFAPFMSPRGAFNHAWHLVGRLDELRALSDHLRDNRVIVARIIAAGGAGKTRFIHAALSQFIAQKPHVRVYALSATEKATLESLDALGADEKLLVVDDAHERDDLPVLFQHAASSDSRTKLLLSLRSYGADLAQHEAAQFGLFDDRVAEVTLAPLAKKDLLQLAREVLSRFGAPMDAAERILDVAGDCPLSTVMAAYVVAKEGRPVELAQGATAFRNMLHARFYRVAAGAIGTKSDEAPLKRLLEFLALVQPFNPEDDRLMSAASGLQNIEKHDASRLLRMLTEGGVIFKRGGLYRISPDFLADVIIENSCVGVGGGSTGFAERVFDAVEGKATEYIITNLGRLDWRRTDGDPSKSRLLDGIWRKLKPEHEYGDPHINAVAAVAYYQPDRAMRFATQIARNSTLVRQAPVILKHVAYNLSHLRDACECLWHVGRNDTRDTNPNPEHAIRILHELCEVKPKKPREFTEAIVDFGLSLLNREDSWTGKYTPLHFLDAALETDGHISIWGKRAITIQNFTVNLDFIRPIRKRVIDALVDVVQRSEVPRASMRCARMLGQALRYPMDDSRRDKWDAEFAPTFDCIERLLNEERLTPIIAVQLLDAVSWHAQYNTGPSNKRAVRIVELMPRSLEFRATLAMVDPWGRLPRKLGKRERDESEAVDSWMKSTASEIVKSCGTNIKDFVERILIELERHGQETRDEPRRLLGMLADESVEFAASVVADNDASVLGQHLDVALSSLLVRRTTDARRSISRNMKSGSVALQRTVGYAYALMPNTKQLEQQDIDVIGTLLTSIDATVVRSGVAALRTLRHRPRVALDLICGANIGISASIADDALAVVMSDLKSMEGSVAPDDVASILSRLDVLPELDGHWIEEFLAFASEKHAEALARFFTSRADRAVREENWQIRPCNHGPYGHVRLRFRKSTTFEAVLSYIVSWMYSGDKNDLLFSTRSSELFATMFAPFDDGILDVILKLAETASEDQLKALSGIVREAPNWVATQKREFVVRFLTRCQQVGDECAAIARSELFGAAVSGMRSGSPGKPFPRDLEIKKSAEDALRELPRFSPAYELYESLLRYAEREIDDAKRRAEMLDE